MLILSGLVELLILQFVICLSNCLYCMLYILLRNAASCGDKVEKCDVFLFVYVDSDHL